MFTPEEVFRIHHAASKYSSTPYELLHEQRKAMYTRMAEAINEEVEAQLSALRGIIRGFVSLHEGKPMNEEALLASAKKILAQHVPSTQREESNDAPTDGRS